MPEKYTLTLLSALATGRTGTNLSNYTYTVNWASVIPETYRNNKFLLEFSFHSDFTSANLAKTAVIYANGLNLYNANFQGQSNILGSLGVKTSRNVSISMWEAKLGDNPAIMCNYPNSSNLNIVILDVINYAYMNVPAM